MFHMLVKAALASHVTHSILVRSLLPVTLPLLPADGLIA